MNPPFVHETALVEDNASVGDGTMIWNHSQIRSGATVGEQCVIGKNVFVDASVVVGSRCKLQNNALLYQGLTVGDDVFIGPAATFTNDLVPRAFNADWTITPTLVESGASIGANATIVCGTSLGAYCMVAAGSTVIRSVESHQLVGGTPARHLGWVCTCGVVVDRSSDRPDVLECGTCREVTA